MKSPLASSTVQGQMELRVKVAELCGWTVSLGWLCRGSWRNRHVGTLIHSVSELDEHDLRDVPDYPNDLNACAEFEKEYITNDDVHYFVYERELRQIIDTQDTGEFLHHATAEQRCLAFIKTMEGK